MFDALAVLFANDAFMPHGHCYLWLPHILWTHVASDAAIGLAYMTIPAALFYFARKRPDIGLNGAIHLFVTFIVLCGLTHFVAIYTIWRPTYLEHGVLKSATALVSILTAIAVWRLMPQLIAAPSIASLREANERLRDEIAARRTTEATLRTQNLQLERLHRESSALAKRLSTSEERLSLAVRGGGVGMWDWNIVTGEVWFSDEWLALIGCEPGDVAFSLEAWEDRLHPDDKPSAMEALRRHLEEDRPYNPTFRMRTNNDDYVWIEAFGAAVRDENGRPVRMSGTHIDVGKIKNAEKLALEQAEELRRQKNELQLVFNNAPVRIWLKDDKNTILRLNGPAAASMGLTIDEATGADTYDLFPEMAAKYHEDDLSVFASGEERVGIIEEYTPRDGEKGWVSTNKVPYTDPISGERYLFVASTDITELVRAREELRRSNVDLEQFARVASHDLQEPLRRIVIFSDFLERGLGDKIPEKSIADLNTIKTSAKRMQQLVKDILGLAKLDAIRIDATPLDPREAIDVALQNVGVEEGPDGRSLAFDDLPFVLAERTLLMQIYQNLIGNARRFAKPDEPLRLSFTAEEDGGRVVLGVKDNGVGIEPEHLSRVFEPLVRLGGRSAAEGTGIGLAICRKAVETLGGDIWVESTPGEGAHFKFSLVRAAPGDATKAAS
ncbi:MAG: ATP-binding protein [Parvularculaceae bacterium]